MIDELRHEAELRAQEAEKLPAFDGISLLRIKRHLEQLLGMIGGQGIFDEYTKHDISHVDAVIKSLEWIIPEATKRIMSPADWLLTVLGIYFHDLGMLVTKAEYERRGESGFPQFRDGELFAGDAGTDYRAKVEELEEGAAERFLYQEFVRHCHGKRIRNWILGEAPEHLGITHKAMKAVVELLDPLGERFRQDLALVCESHHLDDIQDFQKYRVSQPYGNRAEETANVHYATLLLRTADLMHVTSDRAPSVAFNLIDPVDPVSQEEWVKQKEVLAVRPQVGTNKEGFADPAAPRNTIEVHALFTEERGFFGLTALLRYAGKEVEKSHQAARAANLTQAAPHEFPWRRVDDSQVAAKNCVRETFGFTIEQAKILDLLTGHTLYNDTSVVLRELMQNALDAVRFQHHLDLQGNPSAVPGSVKIHWDSKHRTLSVEDNGTGMTQDIIERHLLKVAASRYKDPEFRKQHPGFSPISEFGIGILATFMIADEVEIVTLHPDEKEARRLLLRSVHGRYLIRLLDKLVDETARGLSHHGTLVRVKVRPSAEMPDVVTAARRWVVIPGCEVVVSVDGLDPVKIGFDSLKDALRVGLESQGYSAAEEAEEGKTAGLRIEERQWGGVTMAYAVQWSEYFRDWSFVSFDEREGKTPPLGTAIEGVRVETGSPGFMEERVWAIANSCGPDSPRTNVARSGIEASSARTEMLAKIYRMYFRHVAAEMESLHKERGFSLTWAIDEARYLVGRIIEGQRRRMVAPDQAQGAVDGQLLAEAARELPIFVVEREGRREGCSAATLGQLPAFWTVDSRSTQSGEIMIRETPADASLMGLMDALRLRAPGLPAEPLLCGVRSREGLDRFAFLGREVSKIHVYRENRRVDLQWTAVGEAPLWQELSGGEHTYMWRSSGRPSRHMLAKRDIDVRGLVGEAGVRTLGITFYLHGTAVAEFLDGVVLAVEQRRLREASIGGVLKILQRIGSLASVGDRKAIDDRELRESVRSMSSTAEYAAADRLIEEMVEAGTWQHLLELVGAGPIRIFDASMWTRRTE